MKVKSRWKLKAKTAIFRRLLGFLLSLALLLESSGMQAFAAGMQDTIPATSGPVNAADPAVENPVDDEVGTVDGGDTDIASGKYNGMDWRIDKDGLLTIEGEYQTNNAYGEASWLDYADKIISAKVTATNVKFMYNWFYNCVNLQSIDFTEFDTSQVTNMSYMFYGCSSLTSLNLGSFDTGNVTNIGWMFYNCSSLVGLDLSNMDLSQLQNAEYMFGDCRNLTWINTPINLNIDISLYQDMEDADGNDYSSLPCNQTTSIKLTVNPDNIASGKYKGMNWKIDKDGLLTIKGEYQGNATTGTNWQNYSNQIINAKVTATNVKTMYHWFYNCVNLQSIDFTEFDTSKVTDMSYMFDGCNSLTGLDLSNMDLSQLKRATYMFDSCSNLTWINTPINLNIDIPLSQALEDADGNEYSSLPRNQATSIKLAVNPDNIASGKYMGMSWKIDKDGLLTIKGEYQEDAQTGTNWLGYYNQIINAKVTATNVKTMYHWFYNCVNLQSIDFTEFDTSKVTDMSYMFYGCSSLTSLDLSNFDTSQITDMHYMFFGCSILTSLDLGNFDTNNVTDMSYMFYNCSMLTSLDLGNFNTSNVTRMSGMFYGCSMLTSLDLSNFNTSNVTDMSWMFCDCSSLTNLDVSNFDTSNVTNMCDMFERCSSLVGLDLSNMDLSQLKDAEYMFSGCSSLTWINTPINLNVDISLYQALEDADGNEYSTLPRNQAISIKLAVNPDNIASGKYKGMNWKIDKDGLLTIKGEYQEDAQIGTSWRDYCNQITNAKVTATGVKSTSEWFRNCSNLLNVDLSNFDTSNVTNMSGTFNGCSSLVGLDLSNMDLSKPHYAVSMFRGCSSLTWINTPINLNIDIDLYQVMEDADENMYSTLPRNQATSIKLAVNPDTIALGKYKGMNWKIDKDGLLTIKGEYQEDDQTGTNWQDYCNQIIHAKVTATNVKTMYRWFYNCVNLQSIDFTEFDTSKVTDMSDMFYNCNSLTDLDVSNFDTCNVTDMSRMFTDCSSLTSLDLSNFDTCNVIYKDRMLDGCNSFNWIKTPKKLSTSVRLPFTMQDIYGDMYNWLPENLEESIQLWGKTDYVPLPSGTWYGMDWNINSEGLLTISGEYQDDGACTKNWRFFKDQIKNATVTATNVKSTKEWFKNCSNLTSVDLSHFDTSQVTDMSGMFRGVFLTSLDLSNINTGNVTDMSYMFNGCDSLTSLDLSNFDTSQVTDMSHMFGYCTYLTGLDLSNFDTSNVTNMSYMFSSCFNLTGLDLSNFDTSQVTDMSCMFSCIYDDNWSFSAMTNLDVSNFNTSNVTDMRGMFNGCNSLTSLDVSNFDTSNVTDMREMFYYCASLTSLDVNNFNTSNVTNMSYMFRGCGKLTDLDISNFNTGQVTNMDSMFNGCRSLTSLDVSNFDTNNVTFMGNMFGGCEKLTELDISNFNTSKVTYVGGMFSSCGSLTGLDLSNMDFTKAYGDPRIDTCRSLQWINTPLNLSGDINLPSIMGDEHGKYYITLPRDLTASITLTKAAGNPEEIYASGIWNGMDWTIGTDGSLNISGVCDNQSNNDRSWYSYEHIITSATVTATNVQSTHGWFSKCYHLQNVDLSNFNTSNVTDMSHMFDYCYNLTSLDLSNFDTSQVTDMSYMFSCYEDETPLFSSMTSLDVSNFDTSNVTDMSYMFGACSSLTNLDVSNFDTSNVTDMSYMFFDCSSLTSLDVSNFNTSKVTTAELMFSSCSSLTGLDLSNMDFTNLEESYNMIDYCTSLEWVNTPLNLFEEILLPSIMGDEQGKHYIELPQGQSNTIKLMKTLGKPDEIITTGTWRGLDWCIGGDGSLTIAGVYDAQSTDDTYTPGWRHYPSRIFTSAKIAAANVQSTEEWFFGYRNLQNVDLTDFDTSQVTDMTLMFYNCRSLISLDLSGMNLAKLKYTEWTLKGCNNLEWINTPINLNIDIDLPHTMIDAEGNTYSKLPRGLTTSIKLTKPSTGGETEDKDCIASGKYCGMDWRIDKDGLLTISGEYLEDGACTEASWLEYAHEIINAKINAINVKSTRKWFPECVNLQSVDFTDFDTSQVTDMSCLFDGCGSLTGLDLSNMNLAGLETADHMFEHCDSLEWINTPINLGISIALPCPMSDADGNTYAALLPGQTVSKKLTYIDRLAVIAIADRTYTGKAIKPGVTVTYGKRTLLPGVDYTVTYKNNTNAATAGSAKAPAVIVKGKGNYTDSITETFNILAKPLTESNTTVASMAYTYDGKVKKPAPAVTVDGVKLKAGKDYIVEFPDTVSDAYRQPGRYNVTIKGTGNYQGTVTAALVILTKDQLQASKLKIGKLPACTYIEGTPATPVPTVTYAGKTLVQDTDYSISYRSNDRAGKATLIITGLENTNPQGVYVYGTVEKTFSIKGTALNKARVDYDNKASFTGSAICPVVTLTLNGAVLRPDTDYTVSYGNNINAGKATITLTGCGGYTGTVRKTFTIRPAETAADKLDVVFAKDSATASYSQSGAKPAVTVKINGTTLRSGQDYTVSYKNNKKPAASDAAKAPTIIIKGKGNYKFQKSLTFSIVEKPLDDTDITVAAPDAFLGTKGSLLSAPAVTDGSGKKLKTGRDYIVTGYFVNGQEFDGRSTVSSNTPVTVKLRGTGCYTGETEATYRIVSKDISKAKVTVSQIEFNGGATILTDKMIQEGKIKVTDRATGQELVYGTDYIIAGYQNNAKKGKATLIIQGTGENYGGTKGVKFSIVAKKFKK